MRKFILILLIFSFSYCTKKEPLREKTDLKLNPKKTEEVELGSFIKDFEFVKLESKDNSIIGSVEKILVTDDRIYVLDAYNSIGLYVYSHTGKLIYNIVRYGRGPGEFMGPYDFSIDELENEIIIYDGRGLKLSYFNLKSGEFIKDKNLEFRIRRFTVTDSGYLFYLDNLANPGFNYNIIVTDRDLNVISEHVDILPEMRGVSFIMPTNFTTHNNTTYFTAHSDNNIYKYQNGSFQKYINIDFGEANPPDEFYRKYEVSSERIKVLGNAAYNISTYVETDKFKFFLYWVKTNAKYYLQSKKSETVIHTTNDQLIDDIGVGPLIRWPSAEHKDHLIWFQQAKTLLRFLNDKKNTMSEQEWIVYTKQNEKLVTFAQSITADDNPYLIFMEIDF